MCGEKGGGEGVPGSEKWDVVYERRRIARERRVVVVLEYLEFTRDEKGGAGRV